ncbi:MAG: tetratricopeptide repeat protein [Candidatus Thorarchaeota archaeon]|jgi:tetratricopeptide (TPR) repeat protein
MSHVWSDDSVIVPLELYIQTCFRLSIPTISEQFVHLFSNVAVIFPTVGIDNGRKGYGLRFVQVFALIWLSTNLILFFLSLILKGVEEAEDSMTTDLKLFRLWNSMSLIDSMMDISFIMGNNSRIPEHVYGVMNARRFSAEEKLAFLLQEATSLKKTGSLFSAMKVYAEILRYGLFPSVISEFYQTIFNYYHHRGSGNTDNVMDALNHDISLIQAPDLYLCKANILVNKNEINGAIDTLQIALNKQPKNSATNRMLASIYFSLGQEEEALQVLDKYLKKAKKDVVILFQKGLIHFRRNEYKDAKKCFEKSASADKNNSQHSLLLAAAEARLGDMEKAKSIIGRVMQNQKRGGQPWRDIGVYYSNLSILDMAEYCLERAVYLSPNEPEVVRDLGLIYRNSKQNEKAISFLKSKLKTHGNSDRVLRILSDVLLVEGKSDEAEKYTLEAIKVQPNDPFLQIMLGDILFSKEDSKGSQNAFKKALELSTEKWVIHTKIGFVYLNKWELGEAEEHFKEALSMIPNYNRATIGMEILKQISKKKVSPEKVFEQMKVQFEALASGELPPSKDGQRIRINLWDVLVDEDETSEQ